MTKTCGDQAADGATNDEGGGMELCFSCVFT